MARFYQHKYVQLQHHITPTAQLSSYVPVEEQLNFMIMHMVRLLLDLSICNGTANAFLQASSRSKFAMVDGPLNAARPLLAVTNGSVTQVYEMAQQFPMYATESFPTCSALLEGTLLLRPVGLAAGQPTTLWPFEY